MLVVSCLLMSVWLWCCYFTAGHSAVGARPWTRDKQSGMMFTFFYFVVHSMITCRPSLLVNFVILDHHHFHSIIFHMLHRVAFKISDPHTSFIKPIFLIFFLPRWAYFPCSLQFPFCLPPWPSTAYTVLVGELFKQSLLLRAIPLFLVAVIFFINILSSLRFFL